MAWNELLAAAVALGAVGDGGKSADVHEIERAEGRLRTAAVTYGRAIAQAHRAAGSHAGAPTIASMARDFADRVRAGGYDELAQLAVLVANLADTVQRAPGRPGGKR
jgi:hypothetical protein